MIPFLFAALAGLTVGSALLVILHKNPVTSALFLVMAFCSLAGIYLLLHAEFVGMVQVIVYAGAIMVLFLFVIMYLNLKSDVETGVQIALRRAFGWLVGAILAAEAIVMFAGKWAMGRVLYSRYLFPFEITSLILLAAMVGLIVMGKEHLMIGRRDGRTEVE